MSCCFKSGDAEEESQQKENTAHSIIQPETIQKLNPS
jgi:hypothetical protein